MVEARPPSPTTHKTTHSVRNPGASQAPYVTLKSHSTCSTHVRITRWGHLVT